MSTRIYVQESWMDEIATGRKTVEGRTGPLKKWSGLAQVIWYSSRAEYSAEVTQVRHYGTLEEYLAAEWQQAAPHARDLNHARELYLAIYADNRQVFGDVESRGGMNAIEFIPR
jgi:ASC-1-like (ASCH) protein